MDDTAHIAHTGPVRRIAMIGYDGAQIIDVTGPLSVFATAADILLQDRDGLPRRASRAYQIELLSVGSGPIRTSSGVELVPDAVFSDSMTDGLDTLIVAGGPGAREAVRNRTLIAWIAETATRCRRVASVCTGAFLLAEAGLLDGRRAVTHWRHCDSLARAFPAVTVERDAIHIRDDTIYTSAGVTAGMDLALALVEEDHGRTLALEVARDKVMFLKRPGGQSQFSAALAAQSHDDDRFGALQRWILDNLDTELSVPVLAAKSAMSPRNFARVFSKRTGSTPAKFVEMARLDLCRRRLEESPAPLETIAREAGFGNAERLRKSFFRQFRITPKDYRRRFRAAELTELPEPQYSHEEPIP